MEERASPVRPKRTAAQPKASAYDAERLDRELKLRTQEAEAKKAALLKVDDLLELSSICGVPDQEQVQSLKSFCRKRRTSAAECEKRNDELFQQTAAGAQGLGAMRNPTVCLSHIQSLLAKR